MAERYPKAPIVEVVLDLQIQGRFTESQRSIIVRALREDYPNRAPLKKVNFNFDLATGKAKAWADDLGERLTSQTQLDTVSISTSGISISKFAPYTDWADFSGTALAAWGKAEGQVGQRYLQRVGLRTVNRVDIPGSNGTDLDKYFTTRIFRASEFGSDNQYFMIRTESHYSDNILCIFHSGTVESPVYGVSSYLLDFDVIWVGGLVARSMVAEICEMLHSAKNVLFEASITDRCRELFR